MNPLGTVPVLVSQDEGSIVGIKAIRKHLETRPDLTDHHLFKGKSFQLCYASHSGAFFCWLIFWVFLQYLLFHCLVVLFFWPRSRRRVCNFCCLCKLVPRSWSWLQLCWVDSSSDSWPKWAAPGGLGSRQKKLPFVDHIYFYKLIRIHVSLRLFFLSYKIQGGSGFPTDDIIVSGSGAALN